MKRWPYSQISLLVALTCGYGAAAEMEEEDMALAYGDKRFVSIATGSAQPVSRAPAVASVITAAEIEAMGAIDLDQVLETVPGMHINRSSQVGSPVYVIRGIQSDTNNRVLLLVNGIPMTSVFTGDPGSVSVGQPLENVSRIEVIRGPGSALYGADAFAGVINIVTKTATEIGGHRLGARGGSFGTGAAWWLYGGNVGAMQVAAYLSAGRTDGARRTVEIDNQTPLDGLFGTRISYAPGPTEYGHKDIDAAIDLSQGKWRLRTAYKWRDKVGTGTGVASALDPAGHGSNKRLTADLNYEDKQFSPDWEISAQLAHMYMSQQTNLVLFPPGAFGGAFPDGMRGTPGTKLRRTRVGGTAVYTGWTNHRLRLGMGWEKNDLFDVHETKNFNFAFVPGVGNVPVPTGGMIDVSNVASFQLPHKRTLRYLFAQDEWQLAKDLFLTAGVRRDHYSDFGSTTNPRLALVWEAAFNLTAKLLYSRAFRAPSFSELYNVNNPVQLGYINTKPEKLDSLEAAVNWQVRSNTQLNLSLFRYQMKDIIRFLPNSDPITGATAGNSGRQKGHGFELETVWDASRTVRVSGHYAWQRSTDKTSQTDAGNAPRQQLSAQGDWRFSDNWRLAGRVNRVADRRRQAGDNRPAVPDYTSTDLTLSYGNSRSAWDMSLIARNIFNSDIREPSQAPGLIPRDYPQAGRAWFLQLQRRL
ncbi:TonB-dependent receptor plug domain-containing protein [Chitinimonas arctica]|nr:TonB-dependent receptor [Chitinimonas arctica]